MITLFAPRGHESPLSPGRITRRTRPPSGQGALLVSLEPEERASMITIAEPGGCRFDISLQGGRETVFLRYPGH